MPRVAGLRSLPCNPMSFIAIGLGIALLVPLVTRGSYMRLVMEMRWHWPAFLAGALLLQILVIPRVDGSWRLQFGLFVASYVLLMAFCAANIIHKGMAVVLIGVAVNFVAIVVNSGMPVRVPPDWAARGTITTTVEHHAQDGRDRLTALGDTIILRAIDSAISFGDLIMVVGLCDLTYHASRRRRRTRPGAATVPAAARPARRSAATLTIDLTSDERLPVGVTAGRDDELERFEHA